MTIADIKPGEFFRTSIGGMPSMSKYERIPDQINRWGCKVNARLEGRKTTVRIDDNEHCVIYPPTAEPIPYQGG